MTDVTKKVREWNVGETTESFEYGEEATEEIANDFIDRLTKSLRAAGREPIVLSVSLKVTGMMIVKPAKKGGTP